METSIKNDKIKADDYNKKYCDLFSQAFADKNEESIRNLIDRIYQDGFEDGANS